MWGRGPRAFSASYERGNRSLIYRLGEYPSLSLSQPAAGKRGWLWNTLGYINRAARWPPNYWNSGQIREHAFRIAPRWNYVGIYGPKDYAYRVLDT